MDESERLQRWQLGFEPDWAVDKDKQISSRILALLNHPKINKYCMVDAYYYDFSVIPHAIQEKLQLWRDAYLIFGITTDGEIVSKWVDRWDLDSDDPIVDGKVIHEDKPCNPITNVAIPTIAYTINPLLLSTPTFNFFESCQDVPLPNDNIIDVDCMDLCDTCKGKLLLELDRNFRRSQGLK